MSQEIIEAVREIERDKGIEEGALVAALEDALLAAYKKTPGASRHATVEMDDLGDFRVFSIELPTDVEERLLDDARERKLEELERLEEETGERQHTLIADDDLDVDWSDIPEDQIRREDVTPEGFGRIADQSRHHRGSLGHEGAAGHPLAPRPGVDQDALRARGAGDRRRPRRDPRRRARARLPLEDRRRVARAGRRPGRCSAILANGKRCPNAALPGSKYCGVAAHQALAATDVEGEEPIVLESEPELEALADELEPDAESVGPSLPELELTEVESEAPADVAATHGPDADVLAADNGEPLVSPEAGHAPPPEVPAGIPVEPSGGAEEARDEG